MTRNRARDNDRSQVYAAEDLSAELTILAEPRPIEELQQVALDLCASPWWGHNFDSVPVRVAQNRSDQQSYFTAATRTISLSPIAQDLNTLIHELAHAACFDLGEAGPIHGPRFRGVHVRVRAAVTGARSGADLHELYQQFGLGVDPGLDLVPIDQPPILSTQLYESVRVVGRPDPNGKPVPHRGSIAL